MERVRSYKGRPPDQDSGWSILKTYKDEVLTWTIWKKKQEHSLVWFNYKIVCNGKAKRKGNYWVSRKITTGQIAYARDYTIMMENKPDMWSYIESVFKQETSIFISSNPDWKNYE